ncbi:hypothetical protein DFLDMN_006422 (plasmid) [Cupriavidus sp. H19C3]|jgi:hypothetical protein|uniref:hypothetical protein n=1 Tax=Cupriavidus sp. H19C3 TaxID=3241603 RepID=UPI003BF77BFB
MVSKQFDEAEVSRCNAYELAEREAQQAAEDREADERRERREEEAARYEQARRESDDQDDERRRRAQECDTEVDLDSLSPEERKEWERRQALTDKFNKGVLYAFGGIVSVLVVATVGSLGVIARRAFRSEKY